MRSLRVLLVTGMVAGVLATAATPASAQAVETDACPASIPDAGFTDVDPASVHKRDIDCIADWDITAQVGTYGPSELVSRWQMALFLIRTLELEVPLPDGTPAGFTDLAAVTPEAQLAIYQLAELSITAGTSPTTYEPNGTVTREQMALFLARTVRAGGVTLPDGSAQGFSDITGLSPESQQAINQVRQLGITTGTSATTFSPAAPVTREQMASFLARTFSAIWTLSFSDFSPVICVVPADPATQPLDCSSSGNYRAARTFTVREGFYNDLPFAPGEVDAATGRFELLLDNNPIAVVEKNIVQSGVVYRTWEATFAGGLTGIHQLEGRWFVNGVLFITFTLEVNFV